MKKKILLLLLVMSFLLTGCFGKDSKDIGKELDKKYNDLKSYKLTGDLEIINNDDIYIVESDVHREEICNNVAKLDIKTGEIKSFNVEGNILSSIIADNKFILSDGKKVYVHNLNDFKLEKEFDAKSYDNKVFVSIFKN